MPGFFVTNSNSVPKLINYDPTRCINGEMQYQEWTIRWSVLDKFQDDKIFYQDDSCIILLDGIVFNKNELMEQTGTESWPEAVKRMSEMTEDFFKDFRGAFSGAVYNKAERVWTVFTDQLGNRLVLRCQKGDLFAFGSQINYFADWMKKNDIPRKISREWENDFFAFGYMLDQYTILDGVERIFPGTYIRCSASENTIEERIYYRVKKNIQKRTDEEMIQALDNAFHTAIDRAIHKCREYGYGVVVDISGGLDSRMIATVFSQRNTGKKCRTVGINYAQTGSLDQIISQQVARTLQLDLMSLMMDGGNCLKQIDDLVFMNQGMNYFLGITGGKTVLEMLDRENYGLELWGILGDIYEGAMIVEDDISTPDWNYPRFQTSRYFKNQNSYRPYEDNEIMWFYIRGMLAGENTAFIRQNFMEAPAVYGDVDFLDVLFSIPYEDRAKRHILRKWMMKRYGDMAEIPYSSTGVKVTDNDRQEKLLTYPRRLWNKFARRIWREKYRRTCSMNPLDYWLDTNSDLSAYWDNYYAENLSFVDKNSTAYEKIVRLYTAEDADALGRSMALTAISAIKQYVAN